MKKAYSSPAAWAYVTAAPQLLTSSDDTVKISNEEVGSDFELATKQSSLTFEWE